MMMGKSAMKAFLKYSCFVLLFVLLFILVQENLRDKWAEGEYNVTVKVKGFYAQEENALDVVFIGSSQMYADMAPAVLFREYGIASYDFCANEQPLWVSYYYIREALKHQSPKVVVLDVFTVYGDEDGEEGMLHINLDELPLSLNKLAAIRDSVPARERYAYYFPLAKYHNTWSGFYEGKLTYSFYDADDPYKGYSPFVFAAQYEEQAKEAVREQREIEPLPAKAEEWLRRIIALCREENVPLLLVKTPNGNAKRQKLYNAVEEFARENDTPFFNMNVLLDGQAHVNVLQAEKITQCMGDYLTEHYSFPDRRKDTAYADWEKDAELFYRQKAKCALLCASSCEEYLPLLADERYLVVLCAKNGGGYRFETEKIDRMNRVLGTSCRLDEEEGAGYIAVLDGGEVLYESDGSLEGEDGFTGLAAGLQIEAYSPKMGEDASAKIIIDGTDFSMDIDGLNLAVYDKTLGEMIEMSAFDAADDFALQRK